jgi:hypothetical protein
VPEQTIGTPLTDTPVAPIGEQNDPGFTAPTEGGCVAGGCVAGGAVG